MTFDISNATIVLPGATGPQRVGDMHLDLTLPSLSLSATEKGNARRNTGAALDKVRRAIVRGAASNPVDAAAAATLPTITTAFDGTLGLVLLDDLFNNGKRYFNLLGGFPKDNGIVSGAVHGWFAAPATYNGTTYSKSSTLEFYTDSPKVMVRGAQGTWRVEVNGQFLSKTGNATAAGGGEQQLVFDWGGVRQARLYRIHSTQWFSRVGIDAFSRIWAPGTDDSARVAWLGDSYVEGTGASYPDNNVACLASTLLGFQDPWQCAFGGTGFLNAGAYTTFRGHVADVVNAAPDMVVIAGGTNDASATGIQAEVLLLLQTIRSGLPNIPIVVLGPWPKATGPSAAILAVEAAVSAAVTQFADGFCKFVPVSTDPIGSWTSGTGRVGATTGSGNADVYIGADGAHPNDAGHEFLARLAAPGIRYALSQMA